MPPTKRLAILFSILIILSLACAAPVLSLTPTVDPLQTLPAATMIIVPTDIDQPAATLTPTVTAPAATVTTTATVTLVPTITETATPLIFPTITFERNTNCRLGPAVNYFLATSFLENRSTVVEGRNTDSSWFWVQSRTPGERCWVSVANIKNPDTFSYLPVANFPALPDAPDQLYVDKKNCGTRNSITLQWSNVNGETGFHIYRNGIMLALLKTDATSYTDYPLDARHYFYEIESINNAGLSVRMAITIPGCM